MQVPSVPKFDGFSFSSRNKKEPAADFGRFRKQSGFSVAAHDVHDLMADHIAQTVSMVASRLGVDEAKANEEVRKYWK